MTGNPAAVSPVRTLASCRLTDEVLRLGYAAACCWILTGIDLAAGTFAFSA